MENYAGLIHGYCHRILSGKRQIPSRLESVWKAVREKVHHNWSVERLAEIVHLSDESLRRLSQEETGRSPMEQVAFLRMRHAVIRLFSSHNSISAIAEEVGYKSPLAFSAAFKRVIGVPPSHLRKKRKAN